jgi:hypothetical protein
MASSIETIFPREANNDYRGGKVPFYVYFFVIAQQAFSAIVHYFTYDSGKVQIGGMIRFQGDPDPNEMVWAMGARAGLWELIVLGLFLVVLWRYRNLIPLMYLVVVVEQVLSYGMGAMRPIGPEYFTHTPPAIIAKLPKLVIALVMLILTVRHSQRAEADAAWTTGRQ